jgi:hypothetical protein
MNRALIATVFLGLLSVVLVQTTTDTVTPTFTPTPTATSRNTTNPTLAPFVFETDGVTVIVLTAVMVAIAIFLCGCVIVGDNIQYAIERKTKAN